MLTITELQNKAGECRDIPDRMLLMLGKNIQQHYQLFYNFPPQLVAEAYIDFNARLGKPIDGPGVLHITNVDNVERPFLEYMEA